MKDKHAERHEDLRARQAGEVIGRLEAWRKSFAELHMRKSRLGGSIHGDLFAKEAITKLALKRDNVRRKQAKESRAAAELARQEPLRLAFVAAGGGKRLTKDAVAHFLKARKQTYTGSKAELLGLLARVLRVDMPESDEEDEEDETARFTAAAMPMTAATAAAAAAAAGGVEGEADEEPISTHSTDEATPKFPAPTSAAESARLTQEYLAEVERSFRAELEPDYELMEALFAEEAAGDLRQIWAERVERANGAR